MNIEKDLKSALIIIMNSPDKYTLKFFEGLQPPPSKEELMKLVTMSKKGKCDFSL